MAVITQNQMSIYAQYVRLPLLRSIKLKYLEPETNISMISLSSTSQLMFRLLTPNKSHTLIALSTELKLPLEFPT